MNKYFLIIGIAAVLIIGGVLYSKYGRSESSRPIETGVVREITIVSQKDRWNFVPEVVEINQGDKIIMTVINEDNYDHGIGIDAFGISQRMPANSTIKFEFVATQAGEFPMYCSVPCGEGIVDGKKRTHFDMVGKLQVKSLITETK